MSLTEILGITAGLTGSAVALETAARLTANYTRNRFQWMIIKDKDEFPEMDRTALEKKYFAEDRAFDPELGWVRKPNTSGQDQTFAQFINGEWAYRPSTWTINGKGSRINPGFEDSDPTKISCYGDSFTFARQVNDDETWTHRLSELTDVNVLNWGVGNHGLDQAILRLEREFHLNPTKVVLMGTVADTISRVHSMWKQFYEYGNIWAFKPRFELDKEGGLELIPNIIDSPEKYFELEKNIPQIRKHDYFATERFDKDALQFPYSLSLLRNPGRNFPMIYGVFKQALSELFSQKARAANSTDWKMAKNMRREHLEWTAKLYEDAKAVDLMEALVDRFVSNGQELGFQPVFVMLPQKNEALYAANEGEFYRPFISKISGKLPTIDLTDSILAHPDLDSLYTENTTYGAHYSVAGNALVGETVYRELKERRII